MLITDPHNSFTFSDRCIAGISSGPARRPLSALHSGQYNSWGRSLVVLLRLSLAIQNSILAFAEAQVLPWILICGVALCLGTDLHGNPNPTRWAWLSTAGLYVVPPPFSRGRPPMPLFSHEHLWAKSKRIWVLTIRRSYSATAGHMIVNNFVRIPFYRSLAQANLKINP
jgi:hypothetical protein